jgi:DNA-binding MarR family transcriptional regulator
MDKSEPLARSRAADIAATWKLERPDLDLSGFLLAVYVMRLGRVVDDAYDRMCRRQFGISGADMRVLFALRRAGKPFARRATDLYRALLVTSGAITKQVDRLSALGLVERGPTSPDSGTLVRLTTKGLRAANGAFDSLTRDSVIAQAMNALSAKQRSAGYALCEHLLLELEEHALKDIPRRARAKRRSKNSR